MSQLAESPLPGFLSPAKPSPVVFPSAVTASATPTALGRFPRTAFIFDLGLALLLVGIGIWVTTAGLLPRSTWLSLGFMIPALLLRRILPPTALGLAWISTVAQVATGLDVSFLQVGTVIVIYSAVAYGRRWVVALAAASVIAGVVTVVFYLFNAQSWTWVFVPASNRPYFTPTVVFSLIAFALLGGAWLTGLASRLLRRSQVALAARQSAEDEARQAEAVATLEREKAELARDVHDVVGHSLAVIIAQSDSVRFLDDGDPDALRRTVATIAETARRSLGEVREVLTRIDEVSTNGIGVIPDLDQLLHNVANSGATITSTEEGEPARLSSQAADAAHRVLQEALTNALKFSDRDHPILVHRHWSATSLEIGVRNHVSASRPLVAEAGSGSGLPGMRDRLDAVGGRLEVTSIPAGQIPAGQIPADHGDALYTLLARIPTTGTHS